METDTTPDAATPRTEMIRVRADLAEMLSAIYFHERANSAEVLDPLIRPALTERYNALPPEIRAAIKARRPRGSPTPQPAATA